ncbi:MAG: hypothetical protein A3J46_01170 [Candidatus Yanofskybacteria bacterium RIFCSPHIGHO2_02_FULL_41_11]|uniref:Nudix hydrolase domain-containing protein n=1 Tax=Candidatus Yanofskybacteria bacterium RIFCSPHIGHO2_02_FULL_41_11 TaxID=1802675 RepID=A0A1F8F9Z2_9BACT|nr:MAG: hypothetical protein A3J46_01170 [Candidatus Yanofskybacteria bacterium RIFCSPHIGHO2_02_FULL_41_11]
MTEKAGCGHACVGIIARDNQGRILLIERKEFPYGWAPPSGHCDGRSYPRACFDEFETRMGLTIIGALQPLVLKNPRQNFKCRRGGVYHFWQIFQVCWQGELKPDTSKVKNAKWCSGEEIKILAEKTEKYLAGLKLAEQAEEESHCRALQESIEREWQENPGLEVVWHVFFQELKII